MTQSSSRPSPANAKVKSGGRLLRILLIAGLALIIGGCAFFFIRGLLSDQEPNIPVNVVVLICTQCGAEWAPTPEEFKAMGSPAEIKGLMQAGVDCKKCKAKRGMRVTMECPNCHKHYLPYAFLHSGAAGRDVCPACKADYVEAKAAADSRSR